MTRGLNTVGYYFGRRLNLFEFETGIRETFKTIKLIELTPDLLIGNTDFTDNFFKKIDEIDYMTIEGKNVECRVWQCQKPTQNYSPMLKIS